MQDATDYNNTTVNYSDVTIQPNDILRITIGALKPEIAIPYNKPITQNRGSNSLEIIKLEGYIVSRNQSITLPVLGKISVKNKTIEMLEEHIIKLLEQKGHLVNPSVIIRLLNTKITILGEVNKPGTFNSTEKNLTFLQALGMASDLTINGKRDDILLIREVDGVRTISHINITKSDWFDTDAYYLKPNDVIVVNPNIKQVKTAGFIGETGTVLTIASLILSSIILLTR